MKMESCLTCRDAAMVIMFGIIQIMQMEGISGAALRLESTIATWDDAADGCGVQNYILFPGRSYRAKGVAKLLAEGETVWLNGWRSLTDDTADADGKVKTLKVDLSRPFSSDGIPYICKLGNAFVYPSTHVAVAGEASDGCSNMGQRLATIDSENDYREVLDNIPPDQAHWLHSVTTQGTFFKQCLAARKVGGQLDYIYTKCNNKHKFLCLDDPSIIETFSTVVAQKLIGFADVQEAVDAGATLFQSSTVAVSDSESVTSSSMPASSSLALSVMSTTEMVPSSTEIVPSSTEVVPSSTEVVPSSTEIVPSSSETFVQSSSVIETEEELIQTSSSDWMTSSVFSDETESTDSMELMTTTDTLESSFSSSYIPPMQASQVSTATLTLPLPTAVSQLDMTSSSVMVNDIDSETSTSVIDQTTLYVEESSYSSTEMDFSSSVIKSSSVMAEEVGSKINTALPDEISSSVEASSHMPVGMDYSSSAIKSSSAMIVDVDYETVTDFIDDTSSYVEVSSYTPTDIDYSSPTQVASVTSSPSFSVVVSSTVLVSPGGLVNAFNNTVSTSMLEDSAYDMLPSSSSSMHYQDTQSISVTYTSVIVSTPSELASNFVSAPDVPSSASVTYTSVIVSTPSELASSSVTAPDVLASASVTYTSVTVSTPSELASSSVSAPDVPSSASSAILQSYSTNMDTKITSVYTSSITDHIKYTVSSVIQASSSDVYAVDDSYVFEVTPTYVSIPTSDYEPKYDIIPTAVFEQPGIVTPSVYPEYTDGVDETFDEELETDSESGDSAENETGQSKTFPQQDEGWDVGIWVAFIALLVLVCISLIVAFILYRKRKSSKSKNISNGNTAPPGDTELREKRSLSESPQRESTTFQDKAYDI